MKTHLSIFGTAVLALSLLTPFVRAICECGYAVNSTSSSSYASFTEIQETDFLHLGQDALSYNNREETGWAMQVYNVTPKAARGPYGKAAMGSNVIVNPMKNQYDWAGESVLGGDAGLQVWVRSKTVNSAIPMGEITSMRSDMMYGSYRIGVKLTGIPGTCGAFFWFRNDSQEIDLEYLSWQQSPNATSKNEYHPLNLVLQSPASVAADYNAAGTPDFIVKSLPFTPSNAVHEYRFDWTPNRVSFYADGQWLSDITDYIPKASGQLFLNHWSNGNPNWSGGPPKEDAVMIVSYVKAYFNSTDSMRQKVYNDQCLSKYHGHDRIDHVCQIPDQTVAPDPSAGNNTARTFFFTKGDIPPVWNGSVLYLVMAALLVVGLLEYGFGSV
ncbi:concanavalin A-like lectin/glucanase [Rhizodiscina lignyota]|uniref:Concanavalin A-like lectin/glucanase n=1 Tax=Rhizodiscina lignyota TaxID=1504668 RepID=A0A9P4MBR2_9PEZI|nr:concanavalin A-like lectin/glucanase [Rhizodiscina lignyota]